MLESQIWASLDIGNLRIHIKLVEHPGIWHLKCYSDKIILFVLIFMQLE